MKVTQAYKIVNELANEILGKPIWVDGDGNKYTEKPADIETTANYMVNTDLSNINDIGKLILGATDVDNYVKSLINHIGKVIFVNRVYTPVVPSVLKDGWEYGSILEKIDVTMPESKANPKWNLEDGKTYNQDVFNQPKGVRAKFFNDAVTYEVDFSYTEDQVKESFSNAIQLNSFFSMIETKIKNKMNIDYANLIRGTVNGAITGTIYQDFSSDYSAETHKFNFGEKTGVKAVNLLGKYKDEGYGTELTPQTAMKDLDFLKYCAYQIMLYSDRMVDMSVLFNVGKRERFTPKDLQHIVLLAEFARSADVYLQSDTFHNELTRLPKHEVVNYWQGTGDDYSFANTSRVHITSKVTTDGDNFTPVEIDVNGVIGVIFDHDMLGVNNEKNKVTSHYNGLGDFVNYFYKSFARHFIDFDENCVVFFVA